MKRKMVQYRLPLLIQRGINFINRVRWMKPLAGGSAIAVLTLMRIRKDQYAVQSVFYDGTPVRFRGIDEQALHEVLVDREYAFLTNRLSAIPEPTILDIGAHIGTFAIWVLSINSSARILSVEADPKTHGVAELNVATFTERGADWQVIHCAAADEDGKVLHLSDAGPSMSHAIDPHGTVEVHGKSLTCLLDRIAPDGASVDLVKIDIEGSEEAFLCADPDALKRVKSLVIELHPQLCHTKCVQLLLEKQFGYIKKLGGRKSAKPLLYCWRNVATQRR
jgi:FkbM family methyltransferase